MTVVHNPNRVKPFNPLGIVARPTEISTRDERAEYRLLINGYWSYARMSPNARRRGARR